MVTLVSKKTRICVSATETIGAEIIQIKAGKRKSAVSARRCLSGIAWPSARCLEKMKTALSASPARLAAMASEAGFCGPVAARKSARGEEADRDDC